MKRQADRRGTTISSRRYTNREERTMNAKKTLKGIGKKLREEARDIVEAKLPDRLAELLARLQTVHVK